MSAVIRVSAAVKKLGAATVEQIAPEVPELDHRQILQALGNAKHAGRVRVKVRGNFKGKRPTVWGALEFVPKPRKPQKPRLRPAGSVWDLAAPTIAAGAWPPPYPMARKFNLLGDWTA